MIRQEGHAAKILDMEALGMDYEALSRFLVNESPDVIGIHGTTPTAKFIALAAKVSRLACPHATIVVGGSHATLLPDSVLAEIPEVDYLLRGEAEYTLSKLLNCLETEADSGVIKAIPGIGMRRDGIPFISPDVPHIEHLDALPLPAYDLLPLSRYYGGSPDVEAEKPERSFTMISSRGCPESCAFCCEPY